MKTVPAKSKASKSKAQPVIPARPMITAIVINGKIVSRISGYAVVSSELYYKDKLYSLAQDMQTVKDGVLIHWYKYA